MKKKLIVAEEMQGSAIGLAGKKVLVMGLGLHGGGVATAKWLVKRGAVVTATDLRSKEVLASSIAALKTLPISYVLGQHNEVDFRTHNLVVVNPGVPRESKFLAIAKKEGKRIENDASLFFATNTHPVIAVTGTRGKTTTTLWISELLQKKYPDTRPSGNTPENAFLKESDRLKRADRATPVVAEMSSWQLEYLPVSRRAPHIAVITNLYPDHLNRYKHITAYAEAKANIFKDQHEDDFLILNYENQWTEFYLKKKPKGIVFFVSKKSLPRGVNGLFVRNEQLVFRFDGMEQKLFSVSKFIAERGMHNLENLLCTVLAVKLYDPSIAVSERYMLNVPLPRMRQETIAKREHLTVVNDSCATSPDGTMAAILRFTSPLAKTHMILVVGGTDKMLEFDELAKLMKKRIAPDDVIFLEGSATTKLVAALVAQKYFRGYAALLHAELSTAAAEAFARADEVKGKVTIVFSPGAASFEKFLHEFDRGEKWNVVVQKLLK